MKLLVSKNSAKCKFAYPHDVERIVEACRNQGYSITPSTANWAWEEYSDSMDAGWLHLDKDDVDVVANIMPYLVEIDDGNEDQTKQAS
jgi:hypothetical protein